MPFIDIITTENFGGIYMLSLLLALIYISFISLGLPDAVLGSAWPLVSEEFNVPVSNMGIVTVIISAGTIISSLNSSKLINRFKVHKVTTISILLTAISLFGFSSSPSFLVLCLWAIPYGLGAGSVDTALNNYVAVNFESKHMSWLHCMWGIGATLGPYIMGMALIGGHGFRIGYVVLFIIQAVLSIIIFISSPVWKTKLQQAENQENSAHSLSLREILQIRGVKQIAVAFFCFCAIEHTTGLWASSYLVYNRGIEAEVAAGFSALFYLGITIGRGICGFIAMRFNDKQMIRVGVLIMAMGVGVLFIPAGEYMAFVGITLIGLGSAPVFPCIIHSTPYNFSIKYSQAITGVEMAAAYTGTLIMPAIFGVIGREISFGLYPLFIGISLVIMYLMYEITLKKVETKQ